MEVPVIRRLALPGVLAAAVLTVAPAAALAQSDVESDPVLGPLLDTLMDEEVPGAEAGTVDIGDADAEAAYIAGFRSAAFGMTQDQVVAAITDDFGITEGDLVFETNELERTESIIALVDDLLPDSGSAAVVYIFGYQTQQLIQVNVIWGAPIDENYDVTTLMLTGRSLQRYFGERAYAPDTAYANVMLADGTLVLFTGSDEEGRQVTLSLVTRQAEIGEEDEEPADGSADGAAEGEAETADPDEVRLVPVVLRLSYVADPADPDIFRIDPGTF